MQLEQAHQQSNEASVAGWISSNDVALFAVVLGVVLVLFLQFNLHRSDGENAALSREMEELHRLLGIRTAELDDAEVDNARLATELARFQAFLSDEALKLAGARSEIADLAVQRASLQSTNATLDSLLQEATARLAALEASLGEMRSQNDLLAQRKAQLDTDLLSATEKLALLTKNLQALEVARAELERLKEQRDSELTDTEAKLEVTVRDFAAMSKERELLEQTVKALQERMASLQGELTASNQSLTTIRQEKTQLDETLRLLRQALAQEGAERTEAVQTVETLSENRRLLELQVGALQAQLNNALANNQQLRSALDEQISSGARISRELVGLTGQLKRVAVLVDSSGSMKEEGRWDDVKRIVITWLDHMEVDECVLIMFDITTYQFPEDGSVLPLRGPDGPANRQRLIQRLNAQRPGGWTNTLEAMRLAYACEGIDTILLFTDGAPSSEQSAALNPKAVEQIYALCQQHPGIPVNTIGLGDYFKPDLSGFLRRTAELTGGVFLGR